MIQKKQDFDRRQRWPTSLHEAGHFVADRELLFTEPTAAFVLEGGAGYVIPGSIKGLSFREAVSAACGGQAERLARKFSPPTEEPDLPTFAAHAEAKGVKIWRNVGGTPAVVSGLFPLQRARRLASSSLSSSSSSSSSIDGGAE